MIRYVIALSAFALVTTTISCQPNDSATREQLEKMDKRLAKMQADIEEIKKAPPAAGAANPRARQPRKRPPGPDPKVTYSVPVHDYNPVKGPKDAKVTIVKGFEFACPFCNRVRPTLDALREKYGDDLRVVYKHIIVHPGSATVPAYAACAAGLQGKFPEMEDALWEKAFGKRDFSRENMEKIGSEIGLDMTKFKSDMDGQCKKVVQTDQTEMRRVGAGGTPAFFINGRFLSGARPQPMFEAIIDEELKKANAAIKKGTPASQYYQKYVVEKGEKQLKRE